MLTKRPIWIFAIIVLAVFAAAVLFSSNQAPAAKAQEGPSISGSGAPDFPDASPFLCTITEVAILGNRSHVKCNPADGAIPYFAVSNASTDMMQTNRFLALFNTAFSLGKKVWIYYDLNSAHNPPGCLAADCRKIVGAVIVP